MLQTSAPLLEIAFRVAVLYLALIVLVRLAGKREVGQLGPLDLLAMLILSETVSPALTGGDTSLPAALTAAATLLALTAAIGRLTYHSRRLERWIEGRPVILVEEGNLLEEAARAERISQQDLATALRRNGLATAAAARLAVLEPNGEITVLSKAP